MISDTLFDAEEEIKQYLRDGYGPPDDPVRQCIEHLLQHMEAVRMLPGLDTFDLHPSREAMDVQAIRQRWGPTPATETFPRAVLDDLFDPKKGSVHGKSVG
jgi:hypothetical protein